MEKTVKKNELLRTIFGIATGSGCSLLTSLVGNSFIKGCTAKPLTKFLMELGLSAFSAAAYAFGSESGKKTYDDLMELFNGIRITVNAGESKED